MSFKLLKRKKEYKLNLISNPIPRILKFNHIKKLLCELDGDIVLDYGSGDSPYKELLLTKFKNYISADYEPAHKMYKTHKPDILINENQFVNIGSELVDLVIITEVLEHIYHPHLALLEVFRVLKKGGKVIGSVPFLVGEHEIPYDYYRYTSYCLQKLLIDSGFDKIKIITIGDELGVYLNYFAWPSILLAKLFFKIRLNYIGVIIKLLGNLPLYLYYYLNKNKEINSIFAKLPFGYVFFAEKPD